MATLVVVGAQWGDEAKGKFVDFLGEQSDLVVRYSGGNNAGHTVIFNGLEFRFQLLPVGILHPRVTSVLGSGMVVCPKGLLEELDRTKAKQAELGKLIISSAAHVVFPYHRMLDCLEEEARGVNKIGTTSRGIGPAYQDKVARFGIRMGEFVDPARFQNRLSEVLAYKNRLLTLLGGEPLDFATLYEEYSAYAERLRPHVADTDVVVQNAVASGQRVLFEGAQGSMLDLDHGTYPYVTSSHPVAAGACLGTGIGPRSIDSIIGICKAYATRVGSGPFPTELHDDLGKKIREVGKEYGTVTGRGRRCGWLDLVALRYAARVNSLTGLVVTRLDVLSGLGPIKAATDYTLNGAPIDYVPANGWEFAAVKPTLTEFAGWSGDLRTARRWDDLPVETRDYLTFIEDYTKTPIVMLSVGPDREETIPVRPERIWSAT